MKVTIIKHIFILSKIQSYFICLHCQVSAEPLQMDMGKSRQVLPMERQTGNREQS